MLWEKIKRSDLTRDTIWMLLGQGAQLPIRAVYFILIARSLGAEGYGAFVGVTALVSVLAPFASMGSGNILIKHVARDKSTFPECWGRTIVLTCLSGIALTILTITLSTVLLPSTIPFPLVVSVAIADLIFLSLLGVSCQAFQGFQRLGWTSFLLVLPNGTRLLALIVLILAKKPTPVDLGYIYLGSTGLAFLMAIYLVAKELGKPVYVKGVSNYEIKEGLYFSVAQCSHSIFNDIDKTILTRLSTLEAAGIYAAAYRLIDVAFIPVRSLISASYTRFFQSGVHGMRGTVSLVSKLMPCAVAYGLVASLILFAAAPLLPLVLGREFTETINALRWLSLLPFLKVLHYFPANALTGAGFQGLRSFCLVATAAFNIALNLWLIPEYSWRGAAWASLASDGMFAILIWGSIFWKWKSQNTVLPAAEGK